MTARARRIVGGRLRQLVAWLPAMILPAATAEPLRALLATDVIVGASALTWELFFLANVGALFLGTAEPVDVPNVPSSSCMQARASTQAYDAARESVQGAIGSLARLSFNR